LTAVDAVEVMKNLIISPNRTAKILSCVMGILVVMSVLTTFSTGLNLGGTESQVRKGLIRLFNLDGESNIPEWYSSCLLLSCSALLATIAHVYRGKTYAWHWASLSLAFLYLSLDEAAEIHEMSIKPLRQVFHFTGLLYYGWVVPASVLVLIFGISHLRFLGSLPCSTRLTFILAFIVYVGGAIGVESISGVSASATGEETLSYHLLVTLEETMEMLGLIIFIRGLLQYMADHLGGALVVEVENKKGVRKISNSWGFRAE